MGSGASTPQEGEDKGDGVAKFLGRDLSEQQLVMVDGFRVPVSLVRCRDELYQHGLGQKDLFKQECSAPEVNEFLDFIERGEKFEGQRNAYAVSEAFKKLLKSVPRRLLHDVQHMELEPGTTPQAQWAIFVRVNETARAVLFWVVKFLGEVAQYEDDNGMDPQRLAEAICDCFISELSSKLDMAAAVKHWTPHLAVWIADARDERFSPAGGASQNPSEHKTAAPESKSAEGVGAPGVQGTSVAGPAKNASESKPSSTAVPAETKVAVSDGGKTPTPAQSSNTVVEEKRVEKVEQPVSTAGAETKQADAQPVNVTDSSQTAEAGQATAEAVKRKDDADDEEEEEESEESEESEEAPEPEDDRTTAAGGSSEAATSHSSADGIKEAPANNASNDVASGAQSAAAAPEAKQSHAESAKPDGGDANAGKEPAASGQGLSDDASATSPGPQSRSKNTPTEEDAEASAANSTVDAQVTEKKGKKSKKEKKDRKDKKSRRTSKSGASALLADGAAENGSGSDGTGSAAAPVADDTNKANDHDSYGDASFASAEGGAAAPADKPGDPIKNPTSDADTDADAAGAQTKADKKGKKPKKDKKLRRDSSTARSKTAEGARPKSSSGSGSKEKKKDKKKDKKKSSSKRKKATKVDSDDEPF